MGPGREQSGKDNEEKDAAVQFPIAVDSKVGSGANSKASSTSIDEEQKPDGLTGLQQAAVILMSLEGDNLQKVLADMSPYEIRVLSKAIQKVDDIDILLVEDVLRWALVFLNKATILKSSVDQTKKILASSMGVESIHEQDEFFDGETWKKLSLVDAEILASYFESEHPQTIALVASKLSVGSSAKFLSALPKEIVPDVLLRIAKMDNIRSELLSSIGEALKAEFVVNAQSEKVDYKKQVADIINSCERNIGESFIASLKEIDGEVAGYIEENIFTFERLLSMDNAGIQRVMRDVDKTQLGVALKGTSKEIKDLFFRNMSERVGKIIKEDMAAMGPVKLSDVEAAQSYVIGLVKDLIKSGEVSMSDEQGGGLVE